jgi:hypothetical protein
MRSQLRTSLIVLTLILSGQALGGEGGSPEAPPQHFAYRLQPAGGWNPYGGGLFHWWNPHCFPCQAAPDDYCRKPLPRLCWPAYPRSYVWGPPEFVYPPGRGFEDSNHSH